MNNEVTITVRANNPHELADMLRALAREMGQGVENVTRAVVNEDQTEATLHVQQEQEQPKRGRGRPKKDQTDGADGTLGPVVSDGRPDGPASGAGLGSGNGSGGNGSGGSGASGTDSNLGAAHGSQDHGADTDSGTADTAAGVVAGGAGPADSDARTDTPDGAAAGQGQGIVSDLTPTGARDKAIADMMGFFGNNPKNMSDITKLQTKYGVRMFKEVPDERAHEFYADVKLLLSGSPAA